MIMLEELLKYDKLGSKDELLFLLFKALPLSDNQKIEDLKKYSSSRIFTIGQSFNGIIKLLTCISFIKIHGGKVSINKEQFDPINHSPISDYFVQDDFISALLVYIKTQNSIHYLFNIDAVKYIESDKMFYLKESQIPLKYFPIRNLFLSINFFKRDAFNPNHLLVNPKFNSCFRNIVINELSLQAQNHVQQKFTLAHLQHRLTLNDNMEKKRRYLLKISKEID